MSKDKINIQSYFCTKQRLLYLFIFLSNIFRNIHSLENWGISLGNITRKYHWLGIFSSFNWGIFSHLMHIDQSCVSKKISWIIMKCANILQGLLYRYLNYQQCISLCAKTCLICLQTYDDQISECGFSATAVICAGIYSMLKETFSPEVNFTYLNGLSRFEEGT